MKFNNFYFILLSLFTINLNAQVDWPFENESTQATMVGSIGETRGDGARFHKGADLTNGTDYDIYAINDGSVTWGNPSGVWNQGTSYIRIGDVYYYHCKPKTSILNAASGSIEVEEGDFIGTMITTGSIHVHLQENNTNYLNNNLSPYIDNHAPELITTRFADGYKFYRNGLNRTLNNTALTNLELDDTVTITDPTTLDDVIYKTIYSKIDIVADIEDRRVNSTGGNGAGRTAPFSYEYQLHDYENPDLANPLYEYSLSFDEVPNNLASDFVLHPQSSGAGVVSTHVVTSHARDTPYDRYFNTAIQKDATENWANNNLLNAEYTGNAEFPDDKYRLYIDAYDVDFNDNPNERLANRLDIPVIIDNFLPYITEVEIADATDPTNVFYYAKWEYSTTTENLTLNIITDNTIPPGSNLGFTVKVSENLTDLTLTLGGQNHVLNAGELVFTTTIDIFGLSTSSSNVLRFNGEDLAGNNLLTYPPQLPIRLANGNWPAATSTGPDDWHKITISGGTNGTSFGANFINGASCSGNKRTTTDCLQVCFEDSSEGNISSWSWEFGDFNSSTSTEQNPSFTYTSPGTYDVTLTVINTDNETSSITRTITVDDCSVNIVPLITSSATSGVGPTIITFTDLSTGEIDNRTWNITDSSGNDLTNSIQFITGNENSTNIQLLFPYSGTFYINLELEDSYGDTILSNTIIINISSQPDTNLFVDFNWDSPYYTGSLIQFNSQTSQGCNGFTYQWTFNDYNGAHYSFLPNTTYSFSVPGNYSIELCVTDNCGNQTCTTKYINISNYTSDVVAKMFSPAQNVDWIVYKGDPVSFYDYSYPAEDILYQSWFFDYHAGASGPDAFNWYPININTPVTHTYNEVGTYRVRLYVAEDLFHMGSYEEKTITVVDETDYLEIPTINHTNRQEFNFYMTSFQTRNFDGNLLINALYGTSSSSPKKVQVYNKNSNGDYNLSSTLFEHTPFYQPYLGFGVLVVKGYEDKVVVGYSLPNGGYSLKIFKRNDSDWSSFQELQTITFDGTWPIPGDAYGPYLTYLIRQGSIAMHKNTLVVGHHKVLKDATDWDSSESEIKIYEFNNSTQLYEHKANLHQSVPAYSNNPSNPPNSNELFFGVNDIDISDDTIIATGIVDAYTSNHTPKIYTFNKTDIGWVNSIESAKLESNRSLDASVHWDNNIVSNNIVATGGEEHGINVWEKPNGGWVNNTQTAFLRNYIGNYDDLAANYNKNGSSKNQLIEDSLDTEGIPIFYSSINKSNLITDYEQLISSYPLLSSNGNFIVSKGKRCRDSPENEVLHLFYKDGVSWQDKTVENARLFPSTDTSNEGNPAGNAIDEHNNIITQYFYSNYGGSVLYTFDLNETSIPNTSICIQDIIIENQTTNTVQPGVEGRNIILKNSTMNNGSSLLYQATNSIKVEPNTKINQGALFKAIIVECNLIDQ